MHTPQAAPAALDAGLSQAEHQAIRAVADGLTPADRTAGRQISERVELLDSLKRCAFLLNSARLVMNDQVARDIAGEAVVEARALIARHEVSR